MHNLFVSFKDVNNDFIAIDDKHLIHHLKNVLRIKINEEINIVDEKQNKFICSANDISDKKITFLIKIRLTSKLKPGLKLTIACAIPKNSKFEDIVNKLTQLGVDRIAPILTKRVIVKFSEEKKKERLARWKKIAYSASQQSGRINLPEIDPVKSFNEVLENTKDYSLKLIPTISKESKHIKQVLGRPDLNKIIVFIGPEGDFTPEEIKISQEFGVIPVSLGSTILRVETAAIAAASFIKLYDNF